MKKINITKTIIGVLWILLIIIGLSQNFMVFLTILFFATVILGPFYCGWLCPFGFIQDITNKIAKKANIKQIKIPKNVHNVLKYLKYILFVILLFPIGNFLFNILKYDPRSNFEQILKSETLAIVSIVVIIVFLVVSLFNNRFFCKYLCVEGSKYSAFSFGRLFNIHRTSSCVECGKCTKACPMQIDIQKKSEVTDATCINCMECITSCNVKDAIVFKPTVNNKKLVLFGLSVVLIAGYMLYSNYSAQNLSGNNEQYNAQSNLASGKSEEYEVLTGSANGFKSVITVDVTMNGEEIIDIEVTDQNDDAKWFNQALNVIDRIIESQSTDVDTVSGATYSSQGIINATENALSQDTDSTYQEPEVYEQQIEEQSDASEPETQPSAESGDTKTLTGSANGFKGVVTLEVTMQDDKIAYINVIDHNDDAPWFEQAISVIDDILTAQSTDVDTVSGATYSSQGIINATKNALGQDFEEQSSSGGHGKGRGNH